MIVNTVFLVVIFALTIYGVFHGEDLGAMMEAMRRADVRWLLPGLFCVVFFYLGRIDHHLVHDAFLPDSGEEADMFSVFFRRILFQLYHTVRKRRPADAALLYEKGENISSGINGDSDDRHDHLQSGAGRGGTWACSVRTGLPAPVSDGNPSGFLSGNRSECLLCHSHAYSGFHPALARTILVLGLKIVEKLHLMKRKESRLKKLEASMEVYQNTAAYLGTHKMVLVNVLAITFAQRFALFAATWFVYHAFHLSGISFITHCAAAGGPFPYRLTCCRSGRMGISETPVPENFPARSLEARCFFRR